MLAASPGPGSYNINTEWVKDTICLAPSSAPVILQQEKGCKGTVSFYLHFDYQVCFIKTPAKLSANFFAYQQLKLREDMRV